MRFMNILKASLDWVLIGFFLGYGYAHMTVSHECERLGGFYVNEKVYECKLKERSSERGD